MKKQFLAIGLTLISASIFAADFGSGINTANDINPVTVGSFSAGPFALNANVGAATNLVSDGRSLTGKNPSAFANASAKLPTANGVFGVEYGIAKVNLGSDNASNTRQDLFVTYGTAIGNLHVVAKFGERRFGGYHAREDTSQNVIVGAAYKGLFVAVDKTVKTTGVSGFDMREKVGYTYNVNEKLALTGSANFLQVGANSATKFDHAEVRADYALTKAITVGIVATKGGRTYDNANVPSQFGANISYTF